MQPVSSSFHPLLYNNTKPREVVHTWNINNFFIELIREQDTLKYTTTHTRGTVYTESIEIPPTETIEQMINCLKTCQVLIGENGIPSFLQNHRGWSEINTNGELVTAINLLQSTDDLIWDIFSTSTGKNSCYYFKDVTIPSARCHPSTIALIEMIKTDSLNQHSISFLKNDFKVVRILDNETIEKERRNVKIDKHMVKLDRYRFGPISFESQSSLVKSGSVVGPISFESQSSLVKSGLAASGAGLAASGAGAIYLASNVIAATAGAASSFFGGGVLGTIAGGCVGYVTGGVAFTAGGIPLGVALVGYHLLRDRHYLKQKENILDNRLQILSPEKPLFVEIEPISEPSRIDERVRVSKFTWGVTLITGPQGWSKNHAWIIVEGLANEYFEGELNSKEYFMHKSEFNPEIISGIYPMNRFEEKVKKGVEGTGTWMRSSQQIIAMWEEIKKEIILQKEQIDREEELGISRLGYDFIFSGGNHSCLTWAREKLKLLDIDIGKSIIGSLITIPRNYTLPFKEIKKRPVIVQI